MGVIAYFVLVLLAVIFNVILKALWPELSSECNLANRRHRRQRQQAREYSKKQASFEYGDTIDEMRSVPTICAHGDRNYHQIPSYTCPEQMGVEISDGWD